MARLPVAPTKSNLLSVKDQLTIARDGYELLEQKREILVMELMQMVEKVKLLEADIEKQIGKAYPSLKRMFMAVGRDRAAVAPGLAGVEPQRPGAVPVRPR